MEISSPVVRGVYQRGIISRDEVVSVKAGRVIDREQLHMSEPYEVRAGRWGVTEVIRQYIRSSDANKAFAKYSKLHPWCEIRYAGRTLQRNENTNGGGHPVLLQS